MSEYTKTPWSGKLEALSNGSRGFAVDDSGRFVFESMDLEAIEMAVVAVNNHERLVEALRLIVDELHEKDPDGELLDNTFTEGAVILLATLEAEKGGE